MAIQSCTSCNACPDVVLVPPCGHVLCEDCLLATLAVSNKCSLCDVPRTKAQVATLRLKEPQTPELRVIERHGTKLGTVVNTILDLVKVPKNRIIVFSQYDELLLKFADILSENSIGNYFVRGNVHIRNKAIKEFQEANKPTVLLLSLENAASGTDLAVATHVLLLDPFAGTKEEAKATEAQAIGRAFRQGQKNRLVVIRFVVKNSIEQELHERKIVHSVHSSFDSGNGYGNISCEGMPI